MTTPKPVVLWSYASLVESTDKAATFAPSAASYVPGELLPDPRHELHLEVEGVQFGPGEEVHYPPLKERVQRLIACARKGPSQQAERCLAHLAVLDRPAAVEITRGWSQAELPEGAQPLVTALREFPAAEALDSYLDGLGLTDQLHLDLAEHEERPVTVQEVLLQRGRAHVFSLERSQGNDVLLRELASLAPGVFDGLLFEEIAPEELEEELEDGDEDLEEEPGEELEEEELEEEELEEEELEEEELEAAERLVARGGGKRYEAPARGGFALDDDLIDVDALLGFLNALARARGSDVRWVLFDTDGESCIAVAGLATALESLQARGLIPSTSPERIRAFEASFGRKPPTG